MRLYYWDIETFINCFLFCGVFEDSDEIFMFEISDRVNQRDALLSHLSYLENCKCKMVGYNSVGFDYVVTHELLNNPHTFDAQKAWQLCQQIIHSQNQQNQNAIRVNERKIPQVDLYLVNHFNNANKRTSLKSLQFAMRSESVEDLPFDPSIPLTFPQMDELKKYNVHDVLETKKFGKKCRHLITMRQELLDQGILTGDVLNYNDVKIGVEYLIKKIGRAKCFVKGSNPKQTFREVVNFKDIILPKIFYRTEPFQAVHEWFKNQVVYPKREGERPKLETTLGNLQFHFGLGGVHASVSNSKFESTETHIIKDIDVTGMYVSVAIANGFYPEHLGQDFTVAYRQLQKDRAQYKKGTTMNAVLKLAGNGVYGKSNDVYSCFYDPKYTYTVTVNGQLQLIQLVEVLSLIPGLELIQANTDGITVRMPRAVDAYFQAWKLDWEQNTGLKLEEVEYDKVWIRDVNNFIMVEKSGKIKRKGAYWYPIEEKDYEGWYNKDFSNMSAQKGVEQCLLHGLKPEQVVRLITNPFDFMLRYKTNAGSKVYIGGREMTKTLRYYVSTKGEKGYKLATPKGKIGDWKRKNGLKDSEFNKILSETPYGSWNEKIHTKNKSRYVENRTNIENGRLIKECNHASKFDWSDVDYDYYAQEIRKLLIGESSC